MRASNSRIEHSTEERKTDLQLAIYLFHSKGCWKASSIFMLSVIVQNFTNLIDLHSSRQSQNRQHPVIREHLRFIQNTSNSFETDLPYSTQEFAPLYFPRYSASINGSLCVGRGLLLVHTAEQEGRGYKNNDCEGVAIATAWRSGSCHTV